MALDMINQVLELEPFSLDFIQKETLYKTALHRLTTHHYDRCPAYRKVLDTTGYTADTARLLADYPFLPVRVFKNHDLKSVEDEAVIKKLTSSGTTGQNLSRIYLDKDNSKNQTKALSRIVGSYLGKSRSPMLIIDSKATITNRRSFSARGAGILGFSIFGRDQTYALDENENIDWDGIAAFAEKYPNEQILLFGFTYIIWERFLNELRDSGKRLQLPNAILMHGGGWKKIQNLGIDSQAFKKQVFELTAITKVYDYYGMVEQTGSIFMECDSGRLHCSTYSDIIVRDFLTLQPVAYGVKGLIQLISLLPSSYPGHSLLSEDIGEILGSDDCPCGRKGKYFKVHGRIPKSESRGCSDTYQSDK
jgi:phenylacetate-coenzyme A ligase PaaK-like adenylate-forming protein